MKRQSRTHKEEGTGKSILYIGGSLLGIVIIILAIVFVLYGNKMEEQTDLGSERIAALVQESNTNTQTASTKMGKTVEESQNEEKSKNTITNTQNEQNTVKTTTKSATNKILSNTVSNEKETKTTTNNIENIISEEKETEQITFIKPVEGEIMKDYAKDKLVYSETLEEWTTHLGVDIKAEKTTVVKAVADGKVKSIKNDPRYGLSVVIEHQDGYETLYANLLTSEFVQVGEEVKQGGSIGTVGNTATFEIVDEPHLHFEISKNGENLDPNGYIK